MEKYLRDMEVKGRINSCKYYCTPKEYCVKLQHRIVFGAESLYHCQGCPYYARRG